MEGGSGREEEMIRESESESERERERASARAREGERGIEREREREREMWHATPRTPPDRARCAVG